MALFGWGQRNWPGYGLAEFQPAQGLMEQMAMGTFALAVEIALLLLIAYGIGAGAGYGLHLIWGRVRAPRRLGAAIVVAPAAIERRPRPTPAARLAMAASAEEISPPTRFDPKPKSLPAPRGGAPDDLRQIKGIGPKIEAILHDLGVFHFDQIGAWTLSNMEWVDNRIGFKGRVAREAWITQAKALARLARKAA